MFTGIVTAIGTVKDTQMHGDLRVWIACPFDPAAIAIGASISCSGVCLTVVDRGGTPDDAWFAVDVSAETIACTTEGMWGMARELNLETALKLGDELGGHIVTGHVDAVGHVVTRDEVGGSIRLQVLCAKEIAPFVAPKGSITVDGVSLTVNAVTDNADGGAVFALNIIPHTAAVTTLGGLGEGDGVNLEIDVLARYLKRMQSLTA